MKSFSEQIKEKPWKGWILFLGTIIVVFLLGLPTTGFHGNTSEP